MKTTAFSFLKAKPNKTDLEFKKTKSRLPRLGFQKKTNLSVFGRFSPFRVNQSMLATF